MNPQATVIYLATAFPDWQSLDSVRRAHTDLEGAALAFFALLVVSETLAHLTEDKFKERLFDRIGICLLAIAILAEVAAFPFGQRNDTLSEQIIGSLDIKAGNASTKASSALKDSGTALAQASDAEQRLGEVSLEADALTTRLGIVSKSVDSQRPRRELLLAAAPNIIKSLKRFAGQKVGLYMCRLTPADFEANDTWAALANILAGDTFMGLNKPHFFGADWNEFPTNLIVVTGNCNQQGISIFVSHRATSKTGAAARALSKAIFDVLPPSIYNGSSEQDPDFVKLMNSRGFANKGDAYVAAALDPTLIAVFIGRHPAQ